MLSKAAAALAPTATHPVFRQDLKAPQTFESEAELKQYLEGGGTDADQGPWDAPWNLTSSETLMKAADTLPFQRTLNLYAKEFQSQDQTLRFGRTFVPVTVAHGLKEVNEAIKGACPPIDRAVDIDQMQSRGPLRGMHDLAWLWGLSPSFQSFGCAPQAQGVVRFQHSGAMEIVIVPLQAWLGRTTDKAERFENMTLQKAYGQFAAEMFGAINGAKDTIGVFKKFVVASSSASENISAFLDAGLTLKQDLKIALAELATAMSPAT